MHVRGSHSTHKKRKKKKKKETGHYWIAHMDELCPILCCDAAELMELRGWRSRGWMWKLTVDDRAKRERHRKRERENFPSRQTQWNPLLLVYFFGKRFLFLRTASPEPSRERSFSFSCRREPLELFTPPAKVCEKQLLHIFLKIISLSLCLASFFYSTVPTLHNISLREILKSWTHFLIHLMAVTRETPCKCMLEDLYQQNTKTIR